MLNRLATFIAASRGLGQRRRLRVSLLLVPLIFQLSACAGHRPIEAFTSDGCSLFPDGDLLDTERWKQCCVRHDRAYWAGGSACDRQLADRSFQACVQRSSDNAVLASLMYGGVRIGGTPWLPTWFRWGYGWPYGRGYQSPSADDKTAIRLQLNAEIGPRENWPVPAAFNHALRDRIRP